MPAMVAAGLQKISLIDFPGRVSCVIFLTGCNFKCPYCHNPELAQGQYTDRIPMQDLITFLDLRRSFLDGAVISGGEPTLHPDLDTLCRAVKDFGLDVKLDTNGSRPGAIAALIRESLVDYIAMDLKTAPEHYAPDLCSENVGSAVLESIKIIMDSGVDYEFRTTCVSPFVDTQRVQSMALAVKGARRLVLQKFNSSKTLDSAYCQAAYRGLSHADMQSLRNRFLPLVASCTIR